MLLVAGVRLVAFLLWSVISLLLALLAQIPLQIAPRLGAHLRRAVSVLWARGVCVIIGLRLKTEGEIPKPPFILVTNHLSYVDIVVIMAVVPSIFVAKSEVARWPLLGLMARVGSTVFVNRANKKDLMRVNGVMPQVLARGEGLCFFPEGTSSRGVDVMPFRSSLLEPAVTLAQPVSFASITYTTPDGSVPPDMSICWWGDMTFGAHFWELLQLPRMDGCIRFGAERLSGESRHELASRLHEAVSNTFTPVPQSPASQHDPTHADSQSGEPS